MTPRRFITPAEFAPRLAAAREILREREVGSAIIMGPQAQYWLCGLDTFLGALFPQALILPAAGGAPVLVVWDADSPLARETSIVEDVRTFRFGVDEPASLFVGVARSVAPGLTRVAVDLSS